MMKLSIKYIGLSAILCSAVFVFGGADTFLEQPVDSPQIIHVRPEFVSDDPIPAEHKLTERHKEIAHESQIEVSVVDEDKGPVQPLPVYKQEDAPLIKLVSSR